MSAHPHTHHAPNEIRCKVMTVSDTRTKADDKSGRLIRELLEEQGYQVLGQEIVADEKKEIGRALLSGCRQQNIGVVLVTGGTGIAERDVTYEVVENLLEKELPGFGELFRMLSYSEDIGSAAMMSRAIAGVISSTAIFSMPGSSGAVRLAMKRLILPELSHVVSEIRK